MKSLFYKAAAFIRRDFQTETSYQISFIVEIVQAIMPVFTFYFIGKMIGNNYFPFAVIGVALTQYFNEALHGFAQTIRQSQMTGNLEALLSTKTSTQVIILLSPLYNFIFKLFHIAIIIGISAIFLHVDYSRANIPVAILVLLISIVAFSGIGIMAAAFIVAFKRGNPFEFFFGAFLSLVSGAFFPIDVLPQWLKWLSVINPITYALDASRSALFKGYGIDLLKKDLAILIGMSILFLPIGVLLFIYSVNRAKKDGTLMLY